MKKITIAFDVEKRNKRKYRKLAFGEYGFKKICNKCETTDNICVHHIDENPCNNSKGNLEILCRSCHTRLHSTGKKGVTFNHTQEVKDKIGKSSLGNKNLLGKIPWNKGNKNIPREKIDGMRLKEWCNKTGGSIYLFYKIIRGRKL